MANVPTGCDPNDQTALDELERIVASIDQQLIELRKIRAEKRRLLEQRSAARHPSRRPRLRLIQGERTDPAS